MVGKTTNLELGGYVPKVQKATQSKVFMQNAIKRAQKGAEADIIPKPKKKRRPKSSKAKVPRDPMDAVIEKHLNNPLVVEIMEKYKELEKQPGYEF